jgi:lysophospholipase L1-like esterase
MRKIKIALVFLLSAGILLAQEQKPAFRDDIQAFKKKDSVSFPPSKAILFIGSSSFTMWTNVQEDFPGYKIINRGFGGSTLLDQLRYVNDVVFPYKPKQIFIYCGENDIAASDTVSGEEVARRFTRLFNLIRDQLPKVQITYISMKPSPSRQLMLPRMRRGNELIRKYLATKKRTGYIDVYSEMVDDEGKPRQGIYLDDNLHMNEAGYAIWKKLIEPHLLKQ